MCNRPATESEKNASQRERLEGAIRRAENADKRLCDDSRTIIAAARMHLATLPKPLRWRVSHETPLGNTGGSTTYDTSARAMVEAENLMRAGYVVTVRMAD